ncbi:MAG: hypothetical protein C0502_05940 [Opitutus sp.]|nr:hypothetical protein [Opitutus sp.]
MSPPTTTAASATPTPAPPPKPDRTQQLVALRLLVSAMLEQARPRQVLPVLPPSFDAAQLAGTCAANATKIANAAASLGLEQPGDPKTDGQYASELWQGTLDQIALIQGLYGLPKLPFQPPTKTAR